MLGKEFVARSKYWTPFEILRQATSESAEIIRMAGPLIKAPNFGEMRVGWAADLLLINGEPHKDISLLKNLNESVVLGLLRLYPSPLKLQRCWLLLLTPIT